MRDKLLVQSCTAHTNHGPAILQHLEEEIHSAWQGFVAVVVAAVVVAAVVVGYESRKCGALGRTSGTMARRGIGAACGRSI